MSELVVFAFGALIILVGALGVVASSNPVHSALFLIQTLFGVAVLFVLQEAHFLAAAQIVVYAGAIVILFLFVIMLLGVDTAVDWSVEPIGGQRPLTVIVGTAFLGLALVAVLIVSDSLTGAVTSGGERALDNDFTDVERIGRVMFTDYALAFEVTAVLLTVAVIAAVVLTRRQLRSEMLTDLEPASMDLPAAVPGEEPSDALAVPRAGTAPSVGTVSSESTGH